MLKLASTALVLIQYTLYNIDNVSTILSQFHSERILVQAGYRSKRKKTKKVNGTLLLGLLNRTIATKKKENIVKY